MAEMEEMTMVKALNNALDLMMDRNEKSVVLGEDVGYFGGVFRVTEGLQKKYGEDRVIDAPLAEGGIVGTAVGMALGGLYPIVEIQFADFVFPAVDQIFSEVAKYRYRSAAQYCLPMVIRMPCGGGIRGGLYHSQSPEALFIHTPGLRVVMPSGPYEAKGMLLAAMETKDPIIFFEPKRNYRTLKTPVPREFYTLPLDKAQIVRSGRDVTLVAYGAMVEIAKEAALLAEGEGFDIEVIDLLGLMPFDLQTLTKSVEKTTRLVVVHEAPKTGGFAGEIISAVQEKVFAKLSAPPVRITGFDTPFPYILENHYLPNAQKILQGLMDVIHY